MNKLAHNHFPFLILFISILFFGCQSSSERKEHQSNQQLSKKILKHTHYSTIKEMGGSILKTGFNAGDGYQEVWVRDLNTFIIQSCKVLPQETIKQNLITFLKVQGLDGNLPDGFREWNGEQYDSSYFHPNENVKGILTHKNTVETDQESSMVQAVYKYIQATNDTAFIHEDVLGYTVLQRLEKALKFLMNYRYNKEYGLIWGATTADWGDVQPEHEWGVEINENTHYTLDIYDNAMFLIAIDRYLELETNETKIIHWKNIGERIAVNSRTHLWDPEKEKFRPHIYLNGSPFDPSFDEEAVYYHGGTAVAIEADLLSEDEVLEAYEKMKANVKASGAPSIGLTLYPTYPEGAFKNKGMYPYGYQNGGDWTWFGARMVQQLIRFGYIEEAVEALEPMANRVVKNNGFFEWYAVDGTPKGSGTFRGSAGVLMDAIDMLENWAKENK